MHEDQRDAAADVLARSVVVRSRLTDPPFHEDPTAYFTSGQVADFTARGYAILNRRDAEGVPLVVDRLGRLIVKPTLPRASPGTTLPKGASWNPHDLPGRAAADRRLRQLARRGLHICTVCSETKPIAAFAPDVDGRHCCLDCVDVALADRLPKE